MNLFTLGGIKIGSTVIKGIQDSNLNNALEEILLAGDGNPDPTFAAIGKLNPAIDFTTMAIKIALGACGIKGCTLAAAEMNLCRLENLAVRKSGSFQFKGTVVGGFLVPVSLSVSKFGATTLKYRGVLLSADGSAMPIALTPTGAVLSGEGEVTEAYTLGPVSINGQTLDNVEGFDIDFGIKTEETWPNGLILPTDSSIMTRTPKITIKTTDVVNTITLGIAGAAQSASDSTLQLIDITKGGARGSSPITFSIDDGRISFNNIGASHGQKAMTGIIITPVSDMVNDIIAITGLT